MKFVIDVSLSPQWASFLIDQGFEAVHWSAIGPRDAPDEQIFSWAAGNEHVVMTHDLDFGNLHASWGTRSPSVVQVRCPEVLPVEIGATVVAALRESLRDLEAGALVTVEPFKHRVRILPIQRQKL